MAKDFPYRILVVDDEETVLQTTADILRQEGYQVQIAHDGFEALANLRGSLPELLITDLNMPGMTGFELMSVVRKRFPSIAVIATSAEFTPVSLPAGVLADRFLAKGNTPPMELLEMVRELISESPLRSQPAKMEVAPAWIPQSGRYLVLTCPACLRSFSVPSNGFKVGEHARETCVHCQSEVSYYVDASVVADRPSVADMTRKHIDSTRKSIESSQQAIADSKQTLRDSKRKRNR